MSSDWLFTALTDQSITALLRGCPLLTGASLRGCEKITSDPFLVLISGMYDMTLAGMYIDKEKVAFVINIYWN
jgi:hypothetical protein